MGKRRGLTAVLATLVSLSLFAAPVMANPGNGNGNGHGGGGQGNSSGNHGNKGNQEITGKKEIRPRKTTVHPIIVKITANPITSSLTSVSRQRVIWR